MKGPDMFPDTVLIVLAAFAVTPGVESKGALTPYPVRFPIVQQGKYGFMDCNGLVVIPPQYSSAQDFTEGLACVEKDGKCGYIDPNGREVISLQYSTYANSHFSEGLAAVSVGDRWTGKWGFVDRTGVIVVQPQFELAGWFSEGLAFVVKDGKRGFIDRKGEMVIEPAFELAQWFSEGLAPVRPPGGKWGYIDRTGRFVIPPQFDTAWPFNEGLAEVQKLELTPKVVEKCYCIDKTGKTVIGHPGGPFFEGLAVVNEGSYVEGRWGYKNKRGDYVIKPQFTAARRFSEGLAAVEIGGKWGFIRKDGRLVIQPAFSHCGLFRNGLVPVSIEGTHEYFLPFGAKGHADSEAKLGYIDKMGRYIWRPGR
jgi:hypothetical protein